MVRGPVVGLVILACCMPGCGSRPVGPLVFSGQKVDHWLRELEAEKPAARRRAAEVLGNVAGLDLRAVPGLEKALADKSPVVRAAALVALAKTGTCGMPAAGSIDRLLADPDAQVRAAARLAAQRVRGERVEVQPQ